MQRTRFLDRAMEILLLAMIAVIPLVFNRHIHSAFTMEKLWWLRVITVVFLVVLGVKLFRDGHVALPQSKLTKPLLIYAFISVVNTFISISVATSLFGTHERFIGMFTHLNLLLLPIFVLLTFQEKKQIERALWVMLAVSFVVALVAIIQHEGLILADQWSQDPEARAFGTIGHGNHLAGFLGVSVMVALGLACAARKWWVRIMLIALVGAMLLGIFATASRAGVMGTLGSMVIFFIFFLRILSNQKKYVFRWAGIALAILATLIFVFQKPLWEKVKTLNVTSRTISTIQFVAQGNIPDRMSWWFSSIDMMKKSPIFGHGLSTYKDAYNQFRRKDYRVPGDIQDNITPEAAHMEFLNIGATQGLLGLAAYLWMVLTVLIGLCRYVWKKEMETRDRWIVLGIGTGLLVYLAQVMMSFGVITTLMQFFILLGLGAAFIQNQEEEPRKFFITKGTAGIVIVMIVVWGSLALYGSRREYRAEGFYHAAKIAPEHFVEVPQKFNAVINSYMRAQKEQPYQFVYFADMGEDLLRMTRGMPDQDALPYLTAARDALEYAYKMTQHFPHIMNNLGIVYSDLARITAAQGNTDARAYLNKAVEAYEAAVKNGPNNPLYLMNLGVLYMATQRLEEAMATLEKLLEIRDPYSDADIRLAYISLDIKDKARAKKYIEKVEARDPENKELPRLKWGLGQ